MLKQCQISKVLTHRRKIFSSIVISFFCAIQREAQTSSLLHAWRLSLFICLDVILLLVILVLRCVLPFPTILHFFTSSFLPSLPALSSLFPLLAGAGESEDHWHHHQEDHRLWIAAITLPMRVYLCIEHCQAVYFKDSCRVQVAKTGRTLTSPSTITNDQCTVTLRIIKVSIGTCKCELAVMVDWLISFSLHFSVTGIFLCVYL